MNPTAGNGGLQWVDFDSTATTDIIDRGGSQWAGGSMTKYHGR
jgi:hypothetical protein